MVIMRMAIMIMMIMMMGELVNMCVFWRNSSNGSRKSSDRGSINSNDS